MKKNERVLVSFILLVLFLSGCSEKKQGFENIDIEKVDSIRVVTAMGNPEYGADSKLITDTEEVKQFVEMLNSAMIGKKVNDGDLGVASVSYYYVYSSGHTVAEFVFNGNDTEKVLKRIGGISYEKK